MENSAIEWTDHTFNPWIGCTKVSPGCDHCYAEARMDKRLHRVRWGAGQPRQRTQTWGDPVKWNKRPFYACPECGWRGYAAGSANGVPVCPRPQCAAFVASARACVFCASLADVFDNEVPPQWRGELWALIRATPHLDWLLLTKRIGNARGMLPADWFDGWPNVWLGASIVNQAEADRDIPKLLRMPARRRFLSMEPLLGPVDIAPWLCDFELGRGSQFGNLHWIIVGGESGPKARPMHPAWARSLRDQCNAAGVPFFFKQWGEWAPGSGFDMKPRGYVDHAGRSVNVDACEDFPKDASSADGWSVVHRAGKKAAGRLLDGRTWDEFPA